MLPERAEEMLKNYRTYTGRCGHLETVIAELKSEITVMQADARSDLLNGGGKQPDGMPHGTTVGNPTERIALMLVSGFVTDDIIAARKQIEELEQELRTKRITVTLVEAWLTGLTAKERWMIEKSYFDGLTYREINQRYRETFGDACSKDSLRRIKKDALAKIFGMAK